MRFTIGIPCRDRAGSLRATLQSIAVSIDHLHRSRPPVVVNVLVADDRSEALPAGELGSTFPFVSFVPSIGAGPGAARNTILGCEQTDLFLFTDSDCIVAPDWLAVAHDWFVTGDHAIAQGVPWLFQMNRSGDLAGYEAQLYEHLFATYVIGDRCLQTDTRNLLVRGDFIASHPNLRFPGEMHIAAAEARVWGLRLAEHEVYVEWLPTLRVFHEDPSSLDDALYQKYRHGSGRKHVWPNTPPVDHLVSRYFIGPTSREIPAEYVVPAHTSFLLGYMHAIGQRASLCEWWGRVVEMLLRCPSGFAIERNFVEELEVKLLTRREYGRIHETQS